MGLHNTDMALVNWNSFWSNGSPVLGVCTPAGTNSTELITLLESATMLCSFLIPRPLFYTDCSCISKGGIKAFLRTFFRSFTFFAVWRSLSPLTPKSPFWLRWLLVHSSHFTDQDQSHRAAAEGLEFSQSEFSEAQVSLLLQRLLSSRTCSVSRL